MIKFRKLVIKNFMCFLEVEIHLSHQGIVLVEGQNLDEPGNDSNRSGKSAIIEALVWCLFGKTIRGLKHDKVVNRFSNKNCSVSVALSVGDKTYTVRRYRKHKVHSNSLRLWAGDRLISFRHEDDTQQRIGKILGGDYNSFCNSVIFGGTKPFASLSDSEQKRVLEGFLHFEEFDQALKKTKKLISEVEEETQVLAIKTERYNGHANTLREKLKTLKESEGLFIKELKDRLKDAKRKAGTFQYAPNKPRLRIKEELAEIRLNSLQTREAKYRAKVNQYGKQLGKIRKAVADRALLVGKPCPTCGRKISTDTISAYLEHLVSEKKSVKALLRTSSKKLDRAKRKVKYAVRGLKDLQNKISALNTERTQRREAEEELRRCKQKLRRSLSSASPLEVEISEVSIKHSKALSRQLVCEQKLESLKQTLGDLKFWEKGFGNQGIKSLIIKEALPALNGKLAELSQEIFGGNVELKFLPTKAKKTGEERELFNVHYTAKKGADSYTGESSGGRRRVDICILLCFSWLSRTSNLLLVDELLDGLDGSGRECVLGILAAQRGTTLVISHHRGLKSSIQKVWTVIKKNGYSSLEIT